MAFWSTRKEPDDIELLAVAKRAIRDHDAPRAVECLLKLAKANHPEAEYLLGDIEEFAFNHHAQSVKWYRAAAEHGHAQAAFCLANKHMTGQGTPEDHQEAAKWYRKAADAGIPDAQFVMGEFVRIGRDLPQDLGAARSWYERAAKGGSALAGRRLQELAESPRPSPAVGPVLKAVMVEKLSDAPASMLMSEGLGYFIGDTRPQDHVKAAQYVEAAAEKGLVDAQFMIGKMYMGGQGVARTMERAFHWLCEAADQDHPDANFEVARLYFSGLGVEKDIRKGTAYLRHGASLGSAACVEALKQM